MKLRKHFKMKPGEIVIRNSAILAYREAQKAFQKVRFPEEEVLSDVMELRHKKKAK
jgi:hypothetical protein